MQFPFDSSSVADHRFHGLLQGTISLSPDNKLFLDTAAGPVKLLRYAKGGSQYHAFWLLKQLAKNNGDTIVNVYGYPKTDYEGVVTNFVVMSFFREGTTPSHDGISRKFNPGQMFLCGRIRQINKDGMIAVKVKANKPHPHFRFCYVNGRVTSNVLLNSKTLFMAWTDDSLRLHLSPIKMITPPGMKTAKASS